MTCGKCSHTDVKKFGTYGKLKIQRYRCNHCSATFTPPKPLGTHYTSIEDAEKVVALLMEGMSIRAASRLTGLHKNTILSLLLTIGEKCQKVFDDRIKNIRPKTVSADELWSYVHTKNKRLKDGANPEWGDQYVWVALESNTKMVLSYHLGKRDSMNAFEFIEKLSKRVEGRFQLNTDGFECYLRVIEEIFGADIDYGQLIKIYGKGPALGPDYYRPSEFVTTRRMPLIGNPKKISTSHVERFNLSVRMSLRRCARLTNAYSKSLKHLSAAISLFMAWYNFCRVHESLRVTPCMQGGITDHQWTIRELLNTA